MKDCINYLDGFCIKDIDSARVWDCTCKQKIKRIKECHKQRADFLYKCKYPRLGKNDN